MFFSSWHDLLRILVVGVLGGVGDVRDASAVILESDGSFSVIRSDDLRGQSTLVDVSRAAVPPTSQKEKPQCV